MSRRDPENGGNLNNNNNNRNYQFVGHYRRFIQARFDELRVPYFSRDPTFVYVPPRNESFLYMLHTNMFPKYRFKSFTTVTIVINWVVFLLCAWQGIAEGGSLLEIRHSVLARYGASWPTRVYNDGEVWRWVTACFLHADFLHIFSNTIGTLVATPQIEYAWGWSRTAVIYFLSGVFGNVYSSAVTPTPESLSVGASTCIYGMMACSLSYFILNWNTLSEYLDTAERCTLMCTIVMMSVLVLVMSVPSTTSTVDYAGHFGGFLSGLFLGMAVPAPAQSTEYEKWVRVVAVLLQSLFLVLCFIVFYALKFDSGNTTVTLGGGGVV